MCVFGGGGLSEIRQKRRMKRTFTGNNKHERDTNKTQSTVWFRPGDPPPQKKEHPKCERMCVCFLGNMRTAVRPYGGRGREGMGAGFGWL